MMVLTFLFQHLAMASIFLAAKIEEYPRRIRDVINVFYHINQVRQKTFVSKYFNFFKFYHIHQVRQKMFVSKYFNFFIRKNYTFLH